MKYFYLICLVGLSLFLFSMGDECGSYRWPIKTLTDKKGDSILHSNPQPTTLKILLAEKRIVPDFTSNDSSRYSDEKRLVQVNVVLLKIKQGDDHDFHLVLKSDDGLLMVAEIPDGNCGAYNNFPELRIYFNELRKQVISSIGFIPQKDFKNVNKKITLEGIPFWDKIKKGHAPKYGAANKHEIHPVTKITFK